MKQARPWMLANLKIICQFHAHPLHQNSVDTFWAEIYRVRLLLGPNLVHEYQITAHPYGVDVLSPMAYCTRVSKDTGSSSCERMIFRPSVYIFFLDISNISASLAGIWGRCNLKRSRRTVIFFPAYKISSLKITLPKTLQLKTLNFLQQTIT